MVARPLWHHIFLFSGTSFRMFLSDRVMDLQNKSVVDFFFTPLGDDMFKCTCNKRVKQPGKKGYTNLMSHLKNVHKDSWEDEYRKSKTKEQAVLPYPKVNKKAENIFRWLEWVILENREYSFVDKPLVRKNTKLEPICQKTLQKYIDLVSLEVEKKITSALPSNFGLIVDGWSQQSEHFVGVFACFDVDGVNEKPLLAFSVLPDETDLGADSIAGFIETTLEYYKKTRTDVKFIVSDNEPTMRAVAKKLVIPMIGCASHRLSLLSNIGLFRTIKRFFWKKSTA